jgi:hypothetical protein
VLAGVCLSPQLLKAAAKKPSAEVAAGPRCLVVGLGGGALPMSLARYLPSLQLWACDLGTSNHATPCHASLYFFSRLMFSYPFLSIPFIFVFAYFVPWFFRRREGVGAGQLALRLSTQRPPACHGTCGSILSCFNSFAPFHTVTMYLIPIRSSALSILVL